MRISPLFALIAGLWCGPSDSWSADPPAVFPLSESDRAELTQSVTELRSALKSLQAEQSQAQQVVDIETGINAVDRSIRFQELNKKNSPELARRVLQLSRERLHALQTTGTNWGQSPGRTVLGYRSRIDGTTQPYALTLPNTYQEQGAQRLPLYIELHGRSGEQSEVPFLASQEGKPAPADQTWIQLDVFGRGNNAYRYAGETDVFEALADVIRRYRIDENRIVLWGFSMGGAGAWHLGLHHPSKWCAVGAGAGFVDFYQYQMIDPKLPWFQDLPLRIYDSTNYALNLANVPFITYGGEKDAQLLASTTMRDLAQTLNVPLELVVGPQMGHQFDDASKQTFMTFLKTHETRGLLESSERRKIRFVTCTVKYNTCDWLRVEEQTVPLEESIVESDIEDDNTLHLDTENVAALSVSRTIADTLSIDDSDSFLLSDAAGNLLPEVYFVQQDERWRMLDYEESQAFLEPASPRKRKDLQGPIDDAFSQPFLCIRGTGTPWSPAHQKYADWNLARFQIEFGKWMRGDARTIEDTALTDEQIAEHNLVLFGDPGSNAVLARVLSQLPIRWTEESIEFGGTSYNPNLHCIGLIFPNPLNPHRYVVLNSGHSFHEPEFKATNAQLYPRLGDGGVIRFRPHMTSGFTEEIVTGEIFSSGWGFEE